MRTPFEWYLAGFCSTTVDFNGDTHGRDIAEQDVSEHLDNFEAWGVDFDNGLNHPWVAPNSGAEDE